MDAVALQRTFDVIHAVGAGRTAEHLWIRKRRTHAGENLQSKLDCAQLRLQPFQLQLRGCFVIRLRRVLKRQVLELRY